VPRGPARIVACCALVAGMAPSVGAQGGQQDVVRVDLSVGRSYPIDSPVPVTRVSVANPEVADVAVVGERDVVVIARTAGETDVILYPTGQPRRHFRISVRSPADRMQVSLAVKFAEVRRDVLRQIGVSGRYNYSGDKGNVRAGTGGLRNDQAVDPATGNVNIPDVTQFLTVLTDFGTEELLGLLEAEEQRGNARTLAEPNVIAANRDSASFLAGGELPVPVVQGGGQVNNVTIVFREFGVRLNFVPEILNDSLIKLKVRPEVSSLDFGNSITLSGFRIPALRTRRIETTVDVRRNQSLVISGMFNTDQERVRTGVPLLMHIPILGQLFSSTRFQRNESELVVVVTPVIIDPMRPRAQDVLQIRPDTTLPAREAIERRLQPAAPRPPGGRP
jgi:pilus assembly protein CpaC